MDALVEFIMEMPANALGETLLDMLFTEVSFELREEFERTADEWPFKKRMETYLASGENKSDYGDYDEDLDALISESKGFTFRKYGLSFDTFLLADVDDVSLDFWVRDGVNPQALRHVRNESVNVPADLGWKDVES